MSVEHGGKIVLRLKEADDNRAVYGGDLETPEGAAHVRFQIGVEAGAIEDAVVEGTPPPWLVEAARAVLRSVWRGARESGRFPRRVQRWREDPEARSAGRAKRRPSTEASGREP